MDLRDVLDLDCLGADVGQRILLVLELFLLGPLLRGLLGLLVGCILLLVNLLDALVDLVDAGVGLIYGLLGLSDRSRQLSDLLRPLLGPQLLGQLVLGHRNGRNRGVGRSRLWWVRLEPGQLLAGIRQLASGLAELIHRVRTVLLELGSLLAKLIILICRGIVGDPLLLLGESLLFGRQLVGGLLLRIGLLQLADRQLEIADIGGARFVRSLTANEDVSLLASQSVTEPTRVPRSALEIA